MIGLVVPRTSLYIAAVAVLVACADSANPRDAPTIQPPEITTFIAAYDSAWLDKDTIRIRQLLDSNYVYFNSLGAIRDRQYILDLVGHPTYRTEDMSRTEIEPRIHGALAIVGTRWTATPYYQGNRYDDDQRCVLTLVKESRDLRLIAEHCTEIVEPSAG